MDKMILCSNCQSPVGYNSYFTGYYCAKCGHFETFSNTEEQKNKFFNFEVKEIDLKINDLKNYIGKPVYLPKVSAWALVTKNPFTELLTFSDGSQVSTVDWFSNDCGSIKYFDIKEI